MPSHASQVRKQPGHEGRDHPYVNQLMERYGPMIGGADLVHVAGFQNAAALRQAIHRDKVGFPVFQVPGRRGRFAWTADVAQWLSKLPRTDSPSATSQGGAT